MKKRIAVGVLLLVGGILLYMADVWGMMPKSQEDSETIEQAIARMIADHNDDSVAHSGTGQAIDVHRNSEIIDHLANSIVVDKFSTVKPSSPSALINLDRWSKVGQYGYDNLTGVYVGIETGAAATSYMFAYPGRLLLPSDLTQSCSISFDLAFAGYTEGYLGRFGVSNSATTDYYGVYLEVTDTYTKLVAKNETQTLTTGDLGIDWTDEVPRNIQIVYSGADSGLYVSVDGVQVATLGVPTGGFFQGAQYMLFYMNDTAYNEFSAHIDNLLYGVF